MSKISEELKKQGLITFDGDEKKFEHWLNAPNFYFGRMKPIDVLEQENGEQYVIDELIRIANGIFC